MCVDASSYIHVRLSKSFVIANEKCNLLITFDMEREL